MKLKQIKLWAGLNVVIDGKKYFLISAIRLGFGFVDVFLDGENFMASVEDVENWCVA